MGVKVSRICALCGGATESELDAVCGKCWKAARSLVRRERERADMQEPRYDVYDTLGAIKTLVARDMALDDALLLIKARMEQFYSEPYIVMEIRRRTVEHQEA